MANQGYAAPNSGKDWGAFSVAQPAITPENEISADTITANDTVYVGTHFRIVANETGATGEVFDGDAWNTVVTWP